MDRLTRTVVRHRRWVYAFWFTLFVVGAATAGMVGDRLSYDFSLPGQQGYETQKQLTEAYGVAAEWPSVPVLTAPEGSTIRQSRAEVDAVFDDLRSELPGVRVVDYASTGDERFLTDDGRSTFGLVYWPSELMGSPDLTVADVLAESAPAHGLTGDVTGYGELWLGNGEATDDEGPSVLSETLTGAIGALAVLLFVFASFLALVPLLIAAVSILSTFLIVLLLTTFSDVSFVVQFLVALVGLGVAIDYSLLVVTRWREERALGADNDRAVATAVRTAGHAVLASGVTVAISLLALIVIPVPMLQSMGYGGMLIPLVSVAVVLTLLPALLSGIGRRADWPRIRHENKVSRGWTAWARAVLRGRWVAAGLALGALALLIAPLSGIQIGSINSDSMSASGPAVDTLDALAFQDVGSGVLSPAVILAENESDARAIADVASSVPGVRQATVTPAAGNGLVAVDVVPVEETVDSHSVGVIDDVQAAVEELPGYVGIAGSGPTIVDFRHAVYDNFPWVILILSLVTLVLLMRTFRSVLLPIKAVVLNLLSLGAVFGLVTWFWQDGHGSEAIFGVQATGALTFWIPPMVFAFLFGLSMDYEVFILSRMREEYDATGSTGEAVVRGLGRTGRLVTSAALILFFAFAALASIPDTEMKIFSTALGAGILLDATLVRALLVPALVSLFGSWNWWMPTGLARILRVEPSPRRPERVTLPGPVPEPGPVLEPTG